MPLLPLLFRNAPVAMTSLLVVAIPVGAQAQTAVYGGSPDRILLSIPVRASISGRCAFRSAPGGTLDVGDIIAGFSRDVPFTIECNSAFRVGVQSLYGGLLTQAFPLPGQLANAPYQVALHLVGDPAIPAADAACPAANLVEGASAACTFRGPASATAGLVLAGRSSGAIGSYLRISAPRHAGTALTPSSNYRDTLTVTISASP